MFLHLRTWKGNWFSRDPVVRTRPFGHGENPPSEVFGFAAGLWQDAAAAHYSKRSGRPRPTSISAATPSSG